MTITAVALQPGIQLPATVDPVISALTTAAQITSAVFTNTNSSVELVTIYLVRSGGAPGPANIVIDAQPIAPKQAYVARELSGRNLAGGDTLWGFSTDDAVTNVVVDGFTVS